MEEYTSCFIGLHYMWNGNKKQEFTETMQRNLGSAANPYKLALVCVKLCPDLYKNKSAGMAANVVVELQSFLNRHDNSPYESCLTEAMQNEVFHVAITQKNTGMMRLLVKAYRLGDVREQLLPELRAMVDQQQYKDVCTMATLLNLQEHFSTQELIIPLFCSDRLCLADEFLDSSLTHQKEIVMFVDSVIGKQPEAYSILEKFNITDVSRFKSSKVLSNILARLLKRFKFDLSFCPHLYKRRAVGGLRYLFYKYYIEKGLDASAFHSLVEDALQESPDLKHNLMCLFCEYCDTQSAVPYVAKLQLNFEELPEQIKEAVLTAPSSPEQNDNQQNPTEAASQEEECWDDEDESYSLSIPLNNVIFVDTVTEFEKCVNELSENSVIGLDSEWKPTFGIGTVEQVALLQLATLTHVYLLDIVTLQPLLENGHWTLLGQLFTDVNITKLGYGIKCDFKILAKLHAEFKKALATPKNVIDFDQKKAALLEVKPEIFSFSPSSYKGLSDFVYRCFGRPLNKSQQFSNWANRPLSKSQEMYAAVDARCLIDIYNYLNNKSQDLSISDWQNIKLKTPTKPKNQKKNKQLDVSLSNVVERRKGPIAAKDFHVVCDTMLQGLAKKLRLCGVDAVALENGQSSDDCIEFYEKERRVVLSRGAAYKRLSKFIPAEFVCHVESDGARIQLEEVMESFKVKLSPDDLFARCTKCNSGSYLTVPPSVIRRIKENEETHSDCSAAEWFICEGGDKVNISSGLTEHGVKLKVEKVILAVIDKTERIFVCARCGRCYWEGSHQERAFREIISRFMRTDDEEVERLLRSPFSALDESHSSDEMPDTSYDGTSAKVQDGPLGFVHLDTPDTGPDFEAASVCDIVKQVDELLISE